MLFRTLGTLKLNLVDAEEEVPKRSDPQSAIPIVTRPSCLFPSFHPRARNRVGTTWKEKDNRITQEILPVIGFILTHEAFLEERPVACGAIAMFHEVGGWAMSTTS